MNHSKPDAAGLPFGVYTLRVRVLNANGQPNGGTLFDDPRNPNAIKIPIVMTAPNNVYGSPLEAIIDTTETMFSKDYYRQFSYAPTQTGPVAITFTSGNLTKIFDLLVD